MRSILAATAIAVCMGQFTAAAAENDPRWAAAEKAYRAGNPETGHQLLKKLIDEHPGDVDLAAQTLEKILREAARWNSSDPWVQFAAGRLAALEKTGALSANGGAARNAYNVRIEHLLKEGRNLDVVEELDRLVDENPHGLFWSTLRALAHKGLDTKRTRPLVDELKARSDEDHPDTETRERWRWFAEELKKGSDDLPQPIFELAAGASPLLEAEPDDPDGRWRKVLDSAPSAIVAEIDQLAGEAMTETQIVPWRDKRGWLDPQRALDLHLLSKPKRELAGLRKAQAENYSFELVSASPTAEEILRLFRRYPWALPAQKRLLDLANDYLWAGRAEAASRCFEDLEAHALDEALLDAVRVGTWMVLAQQNRQSELAAAIGKADPQKAFPWRGGTANAAEILAQLKSDTSNVATPRSSPVLADLQTHVVQLPPVPAWPTDSPATGSSVDLAVIGDQLLVSSRNLLMSFDAASPKMPRWTQIQRHPLEEKQRTGYHPGYFRPTLSANGDLLYSRWGFETLPVGLAAFDITNGQPVWSTQRKKVHNRRFAIPLGDPEPADGMLFFLRWNTQHDVNHHQGRRLGLVGFDPKSQIEVWEGTIAESGRTSDLDAKFQQASPSLAIYGNRVTVHHGAVYSNSNAGMIARSDVRDGRTEWIHFYRRNKHAAPSRNLGCAPIIVGDRLICMPRDSGRVFALDQRTGRLVWDNPLLAAVQVLGMHEGLLVVIGTNAVAGLDVENGEARWYHPLNADAIGRAQIIGDSVYFAENDRLFRLDARTGTMEETRDWSLGNARPLGFAIHERMLYVVSDDPADDPQQQIAQPLNTEAPKESTPLSLPLERSWVLQRNRASIVLPPVGSPLAGTAFVLSGGILENIDLSPQGAIRWRRFVSGRGASLHLAGDRVLLFERGQPSTGTGHRLVAFAGSDGRILWDQSTGIPHELGQMIRCGEHLLFHDGRGRIAGIDMATGKNVWQRHLGEGQHLRPHWDGSQLHFFHTTLGRGAHHVNVAPANGEITRKRRIEIKMVKGIPTNGKPIEDGFFEVSFQPTDARYVKLRTLSEINGRGWASAAEFHVVDANGERLSRKGWKASADSSETQSTRYTPSPDKAIDGDPVTWWHTQWLGGIPDHPHEYTIDFGQAQKIKAFHYLPAVIHYNNGMIRDYELVASNDGQNWKKVAEGVMVNRVQINRAFFADTGAMFFESTDHRKRTTAVFRYGLGDEPAAIINGNARILDVSGNYALLDVRDKATNKEVISVYHAHDPNYRFDLDPHIPRGRQNEIYIHGDRLILAEKKIVVADLKSRRFLIEPSKENQPYDNNGTVVRTSPDTLLKFVRKGDQGHALTLIDLRSGKLTEDFLYSETEQLQLQSFNQPRNNPPARRHLAFDNMLLFYDGATLSAWTSSS